MFAAFGIKFIVVASTKLVAVSCSCCGVVQIVAAEVNVASGTSTTSTIAGTVASPVGCKTGFCRLICKAIVNCRVKGYIS